MGRAAGAPGAPAATSETAREPDGHREDRHVTWNDTGAAGDEGDGDPAGYTEAAGYTGGTRGEAEATDTSTFETAREPDGRREDRHATWHDTGERGEGAKERPMGHRHAGVPAGH